MLWHPDTCEGFDKNQGCILEYSGENNAANFITALRKCNRHALVLNNLIHDTVFTENNTRMRVFGIITETFPAKNFLSESLVIDVSGKIIVPKSQFNPAERTQLQTKFAVFTNVLIV